MLLSSMSTLLLLLFTKATAGAVGDSEPVTSLLSSSPLSSPSSLLSSLFLDGNQEKDTNHKRHLFLENSEDDKYINFLELLDPNNDDDDTIANLIQQLKSYVESVDETGTLAINTLLDQFLEEGAISFTLPDGGFQLDLGSDSGITVQKITMGGLNTFQSLAILEPYGMGEDGDEKFTVPETIIQNQFVLETFFLELELIETTVDTNTTTTTTNALAIRLPFEMMTMASVPIRLAVLVQGLKQMPLAAILDYQEYLLVCLSSILDQLEILEFDLDFGTIGTPVLRTKTNDDDDDNENSSIASPFFELVTLLFVSLPQSVPVFFNTTLRGLVNDMIYDNLVVVDTEDDATQQCPTSSLSSSLDSNNSNDALIDFNLFFNDGLPAMAKQLIDEQLIAINPETGLPKINTVVIEPLVASMNEDNNNNNDGSSSSSSSSITFDGGSSNNKNNNVLFDIDTNIAIGGLDADIQIRMESIQLLNLNTMTTPMALLEPMPLEPYQLNNTMTMGLPITERPMTIAMNNLYFSIITDDESDNRIENEINITMEIEAMQMILAVVLKIVQEKLYNFPMEDIFNMHCWLATIVTPTLDEYGIRVPDEEASAGITELVAAMKHMKLGMTCVDDSVGCSSPGMYEMMNLLETTEAQTSVTDTVNAVLNWATSLVVVNSNNDVNGEESENGSSSSLLQMQIDRWLYESSLQCPHSANYNAAAQIPVDYKPLESTSYEYAVDYLILWGSVLLVLIGVLLLVMISIWLYTRYRNRTYLSSSSDDGSENIEKEWLQRVQEKEDDTEYKLNTTTSSMFSGSNHVIPFYVRYGMPIIIIGNIGLFLSGHLNLGATVNIEISFAGDVIRVDNFYNFSIAKSTIDMWKAGGKELAILILIFSGIWPYTKQLITLVVWFLPPSMLPVSKRESILLWVDWLAKWSMIDIFVIVICLAAFHISIVSPDQLAFLPENFYVLNLFLVPKWGLYSNMTAQLVSQVSSHFIIYYHRQIVNNALSSATKGELSGSSSASSTDDACGVESSPLSNYAEANNGTKYVLRTRPFSRPHRDRNETKLIVRTWVHVAIVLLAVVLAAAVIVGCILPTFSTEILGLLGIAVESGQEFKEAVTNHSVISIVQMLFDQARFLDTIGDYIGLTVLSCLFLCTVLIVPILQTVCLIIQWFVPFTSNQRQRMWVLNETLQAWQYIEVYLIALFVASWQLGPVSDYFFNSYCGALDGFLSQMVSYGILKEEDAQCFGVQGTIRAGSFTLFAAAMLLALLSSFVTKATRQHNYYLEKLYIQEDDRADNAAIPNGGDNDENDSDSDTVKSATKLRPFPVMFTDTYRWLLKGSTCTDGQEKSC